MFGLALPIGANLFAIFVAFCAKKLARLAGAAARGLGCIGRGANVLVLLLALVLDFGIPRDRWLR